MSDPALLATAQTPQELISVADALADFSDKLDDYIKASSNPFTPAMIQLRQMDTHIASDASVIADYAVSVLAADIPAALLKLQAQIDSAKEAVKNIGNVKLALSIVAAVLSVAASVSTGNPLNAAESILALAQTVEGAVTAANT